MVEKIKIFLSRIKHSTFYQKSHSLGSFIVMLLLTVMGTSFVLSVIMTLLYGLTKELLHCYAPLRQDSFLGVKYNVVNWSQFKKEIMNMNIVNRHEFNDNNIFFNILGIVLYIVIKFVMVIIF